LTADVAAATAAVEAAEAAEQDLIDAIAGKGGIINPADKAELDALKRMPLMQRKQQLKQKLMPYHRQNKLPKMR
jgi:hypothetical protein